jgi:hypothetical protein
MADPIEDIIGDYGHSPLSNETGWPNSASTSPPTD